MRAPLPVAAALAALLLAACTEETLTELDPGEAPGGSAPTLEIDLLAGQLPAWRDTTFEGFVVPSGSALRFAAELPTLRARSLARVATLPDSITVDAARRAVEEFRTARVRLLLDTAASTIAGDSLEVEVWALARGFDPEAATWSDAAVDEPWSDPGGDFSLRLGALKIDSVPDTLFVALDGADPDSLLRAWRDAEGEPGFAVGLGADAGGRLRITGIALEATVGLEGVDDPQTVLRSPTGSTVIFDPPPPAPGAALRLAGLPVARLYATFELPERVQGFSLRGATINRAGLLLQPLAPPEPLALESSVSASAFELLADPFAFGPKTPIGDAVGGLGRANPDSLAAGEPLVLDVTSLIQRWAAADPDSLRTLRIGVRTVPEGGTLGFWEFGSEEAAAARQPRLRLLVTPSTPFPLP